MPTSVIIAKRHISLREEVLKSFAVVPAERETINLKIQIRKKTKQETGLAQLKPLPKTKIDKISTAGVANAVLGHATFEFGKSMVTPEHKKAATKGDLKNLEAKLVQRYHLVKNLSPNAYGMKPYFDLVKGEVVYRS